jgi:hypothetical protein
LNGFLDSDLGQLLLKIVKIQAVPPQVAQTKNVEDVHKIIVNEDRQSTVWRSLFG